MIRSVTILCHERQGFPEHYFASLLAAEWRAQGRHVMVHAGTGTPPPADAGLLHVDLTRVPRRYLRLTGAFPVTVNAGTGDISKRAVSTNLVARDDAWDGPVIVKTDRNCSGAPERLVGLASGRVARWQEELLDRLPLHWTGRILDGGYPVFAHRREVPDWMWRRQRLVVERFRSERHDDLYCLRQWLFFGDRSVGSIAFGPEPLVKRENIVRREPLGEPPPALWTLRRALGFDYGKFDYVLDGDDVVLFDANRTPSIGGHATARDVDLARQLAPGLDAWGGRA